MADRRVVAGIVSGLPTFTVLQAAAPADLDPHAAAVSPTEVALFWSGVSAGRVTVQRKTGAGPYATLATLGAGENCFLDRGCSPSTAYGYRVALDSGWYSAGVTATTPGPETGGVAAPTGLSVSPSPHDRLGHVRGHQFRRVHLLRGRAAGPGHARVPGRRRARAGDLVHGRGAGPGADLPLPGPGPVHGRGPVGVHPGSAPDDPAPPAGGAGRAGRADGGHRRPDLGGRGLGGRQRRGGGPRGVRRPVEQRLLLLGPVRHRPGRDERVCGDRAGGRAAVRGPGAGGQRGRGE
jgi:hypothetical protein